MEKDNEKEIDSALVSLRNEALTDTERATMRGHLSYFISEHPARAPLSVRIADRFARLSYSTALLHTRPLSAALALVLVVGVGTSYAAEAALPGDALYAIKTGVNEPLMEVLAISSESKAEVQTTQITRRLKEAEALMAEGRLTAAAEEAIGSKLTASARKFDASIHALAGEKGEYAIAKVQSNLEASLRGHERVLAALTRVGDGTAGAPTTARVQTRATLSAASREDAEDSMSARNDESVRIAANERKDTAEAVVGEVHMMMLSAEAAEAGSTTAASTSVEAAIDAMREGDESVERGDFGTAFKTFQAAIRAAQEAEIGIDASNRLDTDVNVMEE